MYWLDNDSGVTTPPAIPPVVSATRQYFTEGGAGEQPSIPGGEWFNMMTDELLAVLTAAGITPTKANHAQLLEAVNAMFVNKNGDTMTGDMLGITAPQFSNDKKFATTEFVQRALGSMAGAGSLAAGSISASHLGKVWQPAEGSTITFPTPTSIGVPVGASIVLMMAARTASTMQPVAGASFLLDTASTAALPMVQGQTFRFTAFNATDWMVEGNLKTDKTFVSVLSSNGYQRLPSGLIIQWVVTSTAAGGRALGTWPILFPNAFLGSVASAGGASSAATVTAAAAGNSSSASTYEAWVANGSAGVNVMIIGIGR